MPFFDGHPAVLTRILHPLDEGAFFRDCWARKPVVLASEARERFDGLFGVAELDEYLFGSSHECMQGEQVLSAFKLCGISHLRESAMTRYLRRGCGGLDRRLHLRARGTRPPAFEAVEGSSGRAMAIGASQPRVSPGCMIVTA